LRRRHGHSPSLRASTVTLTVALLSSSLPIPGLARELPTGAEVHTALERVFARPELRPPAKSWISLLWAKVREKLTEAVLWVLERVGEGLSTPGISVLVIVILSALLLFMLLRMARSVLAGRARPHGALAAAPQTAAAVPLSPEPHLALAREHAAEGRFREAMRALYFGVVLWLDGSRHATYEGSKTGGEYLREISAEPVSSPFRRLLRIFYPVEFGGRSAERGAFEAMHSLAREMGVPA
jgi:hypothetical protein